MKNKEKHVYQQWQDFEVKSSIIIVSLTLFYTMYITFDIKNNRIPISYKSLTTK